MATAAQALHVGSRSPPTHMPALQTSLVVHVFPSEQGELLFEYTQPNVGSHRSSVQELPSSQPPGQLDCA